MRKITAPFAIILGSLLVFMCNGIWASAAQPTPIEPMYTGISRLLPEISISKDGVITCSDVITLRSGYSANVTWELQSGTGAQLTSMATWKDSGTSRLTLNATRIASRGYTYRLKTAIKVYNSNGVLVDDEVKYSRSLSY